MDTHPDTPRWSTGSGFVLCGFLVVAGFFLTPWIPHLGGIAGGVANR
jgi:hypothetical protein